MHHLFGKLKTILIACFCVSMLLEAAWAAEYYVDGAKGNDGNSGTLASPWKTIGKANSTLRAGDTAYLRAGNYSGQQINPKNNGTTGNRITYRIYGNEQVKITNVGTAVLLSNKSYITVTGSPNQKLIISNVDHGATANNAHHLILSYIDFGAMRNYASSRGVNIGAGSTYNWIHHCDFHEYGYFSSSNDYGNMLYIGSSPAAGNAYNLLENSHIYYAGHVPLKVTGKNIVIRNNYFHNEEWYPKDKPAYGNRNMSLNDLDNGKTGWNLIEGNRFAYTGIPSDASYSDGIQHNTHDCIIRKNMFYASKGQGFKIAPLSNTKQVDDNYIYNNVFFYNGVGVSSSYNNAIWIRSNSWSVDNTVIKNNIFYQNGSNLKTSGSVSNTVFENNWESGNPLFVDAAPAKMTNTFNQNYPNFNLQAKSPCIDAGGFLTTTTSSGSGTKIPVKDAHYFMDGWGMQAMGVYGDVIQLKGQTQTARIVSVDYTRNILTVDKALTWSSNLGIGLQYSGSAPDIGAVEAGGTSSPSTLAPPDNLRIVQ